MCKNNKVLMGIIVMLSASFFMGALINKSEASLSVIKAGVDDKGNPLCVNKSQVYLFKKEQTGNKIVFYYHDAKSADASVTKSFPDSESLDSYWEELLRKW
ncbi:MAG: hypothetical protein HN754_01855 [Opitutae bacterium]|jgi:hypothetical protein|nr:hypothetical protein [Opitutae bacterium]